MPLPRGRTSARSPAPKKPEMTTPDRVPRHVAIAVDGNRRWARANGVATAEGHRAGAANVLPFLGWCDEAGIRHVTTWLASTDNLARRSADELATLLPTIDGLIEQIGACGRYRVRALGDLSLVPASTAAALRAAESATFGIDGLTVNMAVGYGGRHEIVDAVRALLRTRLELGEDLETAVQAVTAEAIGDHLYTAGQPEPDLVIRTSGEHRIGGFLMWQAVHAELWFADTLWPDFSQEDLAAALASYAERDRRFGA